MRALRAVPRRPTFWVEVGVAVTWIALALASGVAQGSDGSGGGPLSDGALWICTIGDAAGSAGHAVASGSDAGALDLPSLLAAAPMWALMAGAMMVPPALPAVRHVAVNSLYWRRRRAVLEFLLGFLGIWIAFSIVVLGALSSWAPARSEWALVAALALAAAWQLTPLKWRALRDCHRPSPLPPRGWRASLGAARFGWRNGAACLLSCWAMMVAVALVSSSMLIWMAALTGLIYLEKLNLKPRSAARRVAIPLTAAAIAVAAFAALG
jgi:predicted metal-binding membrane protein